MAFDKFGRFFGIAEDDEMNEAPYSEAEQQGEEVPQAQKNERRANVVSINSGVGATSKIVLYEPRVYSDAKEVAQNLLNNKAVIINFARMDDEQARRIVDFITNKATTGAKEIPAIGGMKRSNISK